MKSRSFEELYLRYPDIYSGFHRIVKHNENYFNFLKDKPYIRNSEEILNIGGGTGELDMSLMKLYPQLKVGFNEMSADYVKSFKTQIESRGLAKHVIEVQETKFEDYEVKHKYDLTLSIHSWYSFGCDEALLRKALSTLNKNGKLFISLVSPNNFTIKLVEVVGAPHEPFHCEHMHIWLKKINIDHIYDTWRFPIVYESILHENDFTELGKKFLQFHSRTPWEEIPAEKISDAKDFLKSKREKDGFLYLENGYVLI